MKTWWEIKTNEDIADACEDAADLLEGHWTSGEWYTTWDVDLTDEEGMYTGESEEYWAYCIEGAMAAAVGLDASSFDQSGDERSRLVECRVHDAVLQTLNADPERYGCKPGTWFDPGEMPNWNDSSAGTEQRALDLLRDTAKRCRS